MSDKQLNSEQIHQRKDSSTCGNRFVPAYLLLGGDIGDVPGTFRQAIKLLTGKSVEVVRSSTIYQSEPWGFQSSTTFYNQAVHICTSLNALELLQLVLNIETQLGRTRKDTKGYVSRHIDIDILLFSNQVIHSDALQVPHPRLAERNFALVPLAELAADAVHPVYKKPISTLVDLSTDALRVWPM